MVGTANLATAGLNEAQAAAVRHRGSPLLIVAGPGSGKTRVIAYRLAGRLAEGVRPEQLVAVTFTNRAAREMQSRLERMSGEPARSVRIGTFHRLAQSILRRHIDRIGYRRSFAILSPAESRAVIRSLAAHSPGMRPATFAAAISSTKNGLQPRLAAERHGLGPEVLSAMVAEYERRLQAMGALDLDDLLLRAVQLLREHEDIRRRLTDFVEEILVDEYQDTNPVQRDMLALLRPRSNDLIAVGDEDQAIYGWRQAGGESAAFRLHFPDAATIILGETYRCSKHILRAACAVIAQNSAREAKFLTTIKPAGPLPICRVCHDERDEGNWVASEVQRLRQGGMPYEEIAILFRVNAQARAVEEGLVRHKIPYSVLSGSRFYEHPDIQCALAVLRLALDATDDAAATLLLRRLPGIGERRLEVLGREAAERAIPVMAVLRTDVLRRLPRQPQAAIARLVEHVDEVAAVRTSALGEIVERAMAAVRELWPPGQDGSGLDTLDELRSLVAELAGARGTVRGLIDRLTLDADAPGESNGVRLLSLHAAKGLEFRAVFLVGLEEGLLPHRRSMEREATLAEERRLCYVGMTRAAEHLYLSYAHMRLLAGQALAGAPSRFLAEMGHANVRVQSSPAVSSRPRLATVRAGQRVRHARWGDGNVAQIEGAGRATLVTIQFDDGGRRRLQLCHAPLISLHEACHERAG